jgi:hypothetical protein
MDLLGGLLVRCNGRHSKRSRRQMPHLLSADANLSAQRPGRPTSPSHVETASHPRLSCRLRILLSSSSCSLLQFRFHLKTHALLSVLFACRPLVIYHPAAIHPPSFTPSQAENTPLSKREGVPDPLHSRLRTAISKDPVSKLLYIHTPAINPPHLPAPFCLYIIRTHPFRLGLSACSLFSISFSLYPCGAVQLTNQPHNQRNDYNQPNYESLTPQSVLY